MTNADNMFYSLGCEHEVIQEEKAIRYYNNAQEIEYFFSLEEQAVYKYVQFEIDNGFTIPELKAINEKCKELGWLDNDEQHIPRID